MRLAQYSQKKVASLSGAWVLLFLVGGLSTGCRNGFIDPTEMGRYERKPLTIQILNHLDTGEDDMDPRFRNATAVRAEDLVATPGDYTLSKNDLVSVSITDLVAPQVESVKNMRISEGGKISLPLIGQIQAAGLTESQLETAVQQAYRDANLIQNATVSVTVLEARGRTFIAYGAIGQMGEYPIYGADFRLVNALSYARGVQSATGIDYIYVIRKYQMPGGAAEPVPGPATRPNTDVLMPRSSAQPNRFNNNQAASANSRHRVSMLTQPADMPATQPATSPEAPGDLEGRSTMIEGRPVSPGQPEPVQPVTPEPMQPAPMPTPEPMQPAPAEAEFQFEPPQVPSDIRVIKVPYAQLNDNGDFRYNIVIRPGDIIWVPNPVIGEYYMGGHVQRVGVYSLTARKITLKQAVVGAGMLDQLAIPQRTQIVRRLSGQDREVFVVVDLAKIFAGEQPDIYLKPEDNVMVGTNFVAPFIAAVRNGFRITYGFGFLYDRNYNDDNNNN